MIPTVGDAHALIRLLKTMRIAMKPEILTSYTDRLSYTPGATVSLFSSSPSPEPAELSLVRLEYALGPSGEIPLPTSVAWRAPEIVAVYPQWGKFGSFAVGSANLGCHLARSVRVWVANLDGER